MPYTPNTERIAKNTLLLYLRMGLMMCINLYTSRIVLHALGVEDFGIYNVVGGVIVMFSFITDSMTASTQRFLTFELGSGNKEKLHAVFVTSIHIHLLITLLIIFLGETIGLWFFMEKMVIPRAFSSLKILLYDLSNVVGNRFRKYQIGLIAQHRFPLEF